MKIIDVEVVLVDEPAYAPAFRWRDGLPGSEPAFTSGWLVITTDDGVRGYAQCARGRILADVVNRRLRAELIGQNPWNREWIFHRMWEIERIETLPTYLYGIVDVALWDIAGKYAQQPVHRLLGTYRESMPAYASTVTFDSVEEYLDVARQCLDLGFTAIKLHAWGDVRRDAHLSQALRDEVGDDVTLMYDGSAGFDLLDATYLGHALADAGYLWYEEPMREFSVNAYQRLAERVAVPLLVGETSPGAHMNTGDFIASGCAAAVRTGATLRGGITGSMRIAALADSYLLRAEVHGGGAANTHLCMSIPNSTYYEALIDSTNVVRPPEVDASGNVHAPDAPGIGYERAWESVGIPAGLGSFAA